MTIISFFKELLLRVQQDSPDFYKKLQWSAGLFLAILSLIVTGNGMFDWGLDNIFIFKMPLTSIINILIGFITGIFAVSFTPVKDQNKL